MNILHFFRTQEWVIVRRAILIGLIVVLAYRTWGAPLLSSFQTANAARDITITKSEFRQDAPGTRPIWIIGMRNNSRRFGYDRIKVETTYVNNSGAVIQRDEMTLRQKLVPGQEEVIGSTDLQERPGATDGTLKIIAAEVLK